MFDATEDCARRCVEQSETDADARRSEVQRMMVDCDAALQEMFNVRIRVAMVNEEISEDESELGQSKEECQVLEKQGHQLNVAQDGDEGA
eukprot:9471264-Pyramimonas_sp.AAC.1